MKILMLVDCQIIVAAELSLRQDKLIPDNLFGVLIRCNTCIDKFHNFPQILELTSVVYNMWGNR